MNTQFLLYDYKMIVFLLSYQETNCKLTMFYSTFNKLEIIFNKSIH